MSFHDLRHQERQAHCAVLRHQLGLLGMRMDLCVHECRGEKRRAHLRQFRHQRQHLEFLQQAATRCWPFSIN